MATKIVRALSFLLIPLLVLTLPGLAQSGHKRVVSLAPSNTEIIFALDADSRLIGVSDACDYPPAARKKAQVGSFMNIRQEKLACLHPDLLLLVNGQESLSALAAKQGVACEILPNRHLNDIAKCVRRIGILLGITKESESFASKFEADLAKLGEIIKQAKTKPKVFICIWPGPILTVGQDSFIDEAITICGGTNIAGNLRGGYPKISPEKLVLSDPDVIILPFQSKKQKMIERTPWENLTAIKNGRYDYLPLPAEDSLSRPTPRILEGLHWLAVRIHPELKFKLDQWLSGCKVSAIKNLKPPGV
ncbi:MAG: helical backbone metal receptor [Candidatus Obscuribacterales bacterium]|nr:helical backbone metal receptor [Candidatus Obscuribacterales bacterium]